MGFFAAVAGRSEVFGGLGTEPSQLVFVVPTGHRGPHQTTSWSPAAPTSRMPSAPDSVLARLCRMETNAASGLDDPAYRAAVIDLLGVLAYGELTACIRMATDSDLAPSLRIKAQMAGFAATEYKHYELLVERIEALGVSAEVAMQPFVAPFTAYHDRTAPKSWIEGLVKAYVGDGIAKDFYREMGSFVDDETRAVMDRALDDEGTGDFVVSIVRDTLKTDPTSRGRLSLWGRRLLGEALSQGQAVAVERDALSGLLVGGGADLTEIGAMFTRLTDRHSQRMARLGLSA